MHSVAAFAVVDLRYNFVEWSVHASVQLVFWADGYLLRKVDIDGFTLLGSNRRGRTANAQVLNYLLYILFHKDVQNLELCFVVDFAERVQLVVVGGTVRDNSRRSV